MKTNVLIYVHGIGRRNRDEDIGRVLDQIDTESQSSDRNSIGKARNYSYDVEYCENINEYVRITSFNRVVYLNGKPRPTVRIKIYECYWSHKAVNRIGILRTLTWGMGKLLDPLRPRFGSWRNYQLYRLKHLSQLRDKWTVDQLNLISNAYRSFDNWENRKVFPEGSRKQFIEFCATQAGFVSSRKGAALVKNWIRSCDRSSWKRFTPFLTIYVLLSAMMAHFIISIGYFIAAVSSFYRGTNVSFVLKDPLSYYNFLFVLFSLTLLINILIFIKNHLSDVLYWTMSDEKNRVYATKKEIAEYVSDFFMHALSKNPESNVTVAAHSLGSAIAYETLVDLGRKNASKTGHKFAMQDNGIGRVRTLVTFGSPIDLIFDTFQSSTAVSRRYGRINFERRRSIALPPFSNNLEAGTLWVNFWSRFDPISSALHSPMNAKNFRAARFLNVETEVPGIALPGTAHDSYFKDKNFSSFLFLSIMKDGHYTTQSSIVTSYLDLSLLFLQKLFPITIIVHSTLFVAAGGNINRYNITSFSVMLLNAFFMTCAGRLRR